MSTDMMSLDTWGEKRPALKVFGMFTAEVKLHGHTALLPVCVMAEDGPSLLGRSWFKSLGVGITVLSALETYEDCSGESERPVSKLSEVVEPPLEVPLYGQASNPGAASPAVSSTTVKPRPDVEIRQRPGEPKPATEASEGWPQPISSTRRQCPNWRSCSCLQAQEKPAQVKIKFLKRYASLDSVLWHNSKF